MNKIQEACFIDLLEHIIANENITCEEKIVKIKYWIELRDEL